MKLINPVEDPDGQPRSFYTYKVPFDRLCRCIASMSGVEFTRRPRFYWSGEDAIAEFRLKGHEFKVETIWADTHVCPKDDVSSYPEIVEIEEHVERNGHSLLGRWLNQLFGKKKEAKTPTTESTLSSEGAPSAER